MTAATAPQSGSVPETYQKCLSFVANLEDLYDDHGASFIEKTPAGRFQEKTDAVKHIPNIVCCSPHPDDEALTGALPLRLQRDAGATVYNIAVTLGSDKRRKEQRREELRQSCEVLKFIPRLSRNPLGLEPATLIHLHEDAAWIKTVDEVVSLFKEIDPQLVLFPHAFDKHPTHEATNVLVLEALKVYTGKNNSRVFTAEWEYWHPMNNANLLLGVPKEDVALLMTALTRHSGEIARNPYHLHLPARLIDNVFRCGETIEGFGPARRHFLFGAVYRIGCVGKGELLHTDKAEIFPAAKRMTFDLFESYFA